MDAPEAQRTSPGSPGLDQRHRSAMYIRSFIFGGEDSLVSTVGLLSGIAVAGVERADVVLTGVVLIFVEALSMAVGSFLSENSAEEFLDRSELPLRTAVSTGSIMFGAYFVLGFIPLLPYLFSESTLATPWSVALSLTALFGLGWFTGRRFRVKAWKSGLKMLILGGAAILVGVVVGRLFSA